MKRSLLSKYRMRQGLGMTDGMLLKKTLQYSSPEPFTTGPTVKPKTTLVPTIQKIQLNSRVVDQYKNPLQGAHVLTSTGLKTITDAKGLFSLELPKAAYITISYLGYKKYTAQAGSLPSVVMLEPEITALDEVVVGPPKPEAKAPVRTGGGITQKAAVNWLLALAIGGLVASRVIKKEKAVKVTL